MDEIAKSIGYVVMAFGGIACLGILGIVAAKVSNKASHMVLDAYGGWKVFQEFREWYHHERPKVVSEKPFKDS